MVLLVIAEYFLSVTSSNLKGSLTQGQALFLVMLNALTSFSLILTIFLWFINKKGNNLDENNHGSTKISFFNTVKKYFGRVKISSPSFVIIIFLLLVSGAFYWYEWRPAEIRKKCESLALHRSNISETLRKEIYFRCVREAGLESSQF